MPGRWSIGIGYYTTAESDFKQVIAEYPDNKYAMASLKALFALNPAVYDSNYTPLQSYYDSLALNPGDSLLGKSAEWLSIHCKINNKEYQQAINSLDSILNNPGTYADSVFALIDLCEVFAEMNDTSSLKSSLITKNPAVIPGSYKEFLIQRKDWIDLLLKTTGGGSQEDIILVNKAKEWRLVIITSIHPNPATDNFVVEYMSDKRGMINISLVSNTGLVLSNLKEGMTEIGEYNEIIKMTDLPAGLYFIIIAFDGIISDTRKLIIAR